MNSTIGPWQVSQAPPRELGEGARQIGAECLHVDLLAGHVYLTNPTSDTTRLLFEIDGPVGALAPVAEHDQWIAAAGTGVVLIDDDGSTTPIADLVAASEYPMRVNDACADPTGAFWVGTMAFDPTQTPGGLYRMAPDRTVTCVMDDIRIPNGPVFDRTGTTLYVADSDAGIIYRAAVAPSGEVGARTEFARVDDGNPDGMSIDADGYLWSAIWGAGRINRYHPDGRCVARIPVPVSQPTSIAFVDGWIVVTSATVGMADPGPTEGKTLRARTTLRGLPTAKFRDVTGAGARHHR